MRSNFTVKTLLIFGISSCFISGVANAQFGDFKGDGSGNRPGANPCTLFLRVGGGFSIEDETKGRVWNGMSNHVANVATRDLGPWVGREFSAKEQNRILDALTAKGYDVHVVNVEQAVKERSHAVAEGIIDVHQDPPAGKRAEPLIKGVVPFKIKYLRVNISLSKVDPKATNKKLIDVDYAAKDSFAPWPAIADGIVAQIKTIPSCPFVENEKDRVIKVRTDVPPPPRAATQPYQPVEESAAGSVPAQ